ncbi:MAG: type II toxin-antitoxin system RelE/ParE family toxin [Thiomicrorhabdus sp.]|nr:type II toxin-antitoxin system RelE/ParE family toxin [Thiomicrorhabdus sp.]
MTWEVKYEEHVAKSLKKIDPVIRKRIKNFIEERLIHAENPKEIGEPLKGILNEYWRWRVGDYRIIGEIHENDIIIVILKVGHRRKVYS